MTQDINWYETHLAEFLFEKICQDFLKFLNEDTLGKFNDMFLTRIKALNDDASLKQLFQEAFGFLSSIDIDYN